MDRKKFTYNVIQDLWKLANLPACQKNKSEMTDEDWEALIDGVNQACVKYMKTDAIRPEEEYFALSMINGFMEFIDNQDKVRLLVPSKSLTSFEWLTPKMAKQYYNIDVPARSEV